MLGFFTEPYVRITLTIIVLVVIFIILSRNKRQKATDSLSILQERYEKGELTKEEYEEALKRRGK
ncbi:short C-terminal domain protein [Oceanobacillus picturae]|jgi:putative membrane protein|uniref:Short C-terminal domain protein n=2 Tax=Oceanobacillus TaxID=182709 RepID=A0A0U9H1T9_9BACI|nr:MULTISPECIES: SHOCT domain-containing protein [Oceanobacillus]MCG3419259.1 SHOCT domain-containing protein [Oceanobacillus jordanicus]NAO99594.1 SHOCT domain-containing protein [Halomonas sp. MG34]GAQ16565.1 short C-terminal domain protein [Oceanobacillus picturae]